MKKNIQTKFGTKSSKGERLTYGNCLATCIASILDKQPEMVPNIEVFYMPGDSKKDDPMWLDVLNIWLCNKHSSIIIKSRNVEDLPQRDYFISRGVSPRGTRHCIVTSKTYPAHDPHPSGEGLTEIDYYLYLKKLPIRF